MAGAKREEATEQRGKANPCHGSASVAHTRNSLVGFAGSFDGRYWARTSDPQLVELVQPCASVRSRRSDSMVDRIRQSSERLSEPERTPVLAIPATPGAV